MTTVRRRWVVALAALAVAFAVATVGSASLWLQAILIPWPSFDGSTDQAVIDAYIAEAQVADRFYTLVPWLATAALVSGVTALALAARRAQLAVFASATASWEASRSAATSAGSAESIS